MSLTSYIGHRRGTRRPVTDPTGLVPVLITDGAQH